MEEKIKNVVISCVKETVEDLDQSIEISDDLALFGKESPFDSITLVSLIVDIEGELADQGIEVSLNSEKAMSAKNSPFKSISALVEFIKSEAE